MKQILNEKMPYWRKWLVLASGVVFAACSYLLYSAWFYKIGFPLDDAWIHQTYARNLAEIGEWSFIPGNPSAGSTAPFWSVLLATGYWFGVSTHIWAFLLGFSCLLCIGVVGDSFYVSQNLKPKIGFPWFGLFLVLEWHLVWAAASGMETLLHALGILTTLYLISLPKKKWFWVGLLIGVIIWVRPDGLTLLGPAGFVLILESKLWRERLQETGRLTSGFLAGFIPYLYFNFQLSGSMFPNTFYAKQAEYAILYQFPLIERLIDLFSLPMVGAGAMLLPGVFYGVWMALRQQRWTYLGAFLWWAGYTGLYALRLPVAYQHGRYLMPSMPVYFLLGALGMAQLFQRFKMEKRLNVVISRVWIASTIIIAAAFFALGAQAYAEDVAIIETEMVYTARWIAENTPSDALIAAHDIGAMGYFANRDLLDLAGLISPDVIPFIRDEEQLEQFITGKNADYIVIFPGWYKRLHRNKEMLYQTNGVFSPAAGGQNMAIYQWHK